MKEGYLPKDQRKKILLICDDIRMHSGIATVGKEVVLGTSHHYNWVNIGGAIQHPDFGKRFDLSEDTGVQAGIEDANVILYPANGYGDHAFLRQILDLEKPDAIMLITDPRYFTWLFSIENEIRRTIPIIYLNIWDDLPAPHYNKTFYESCDVLFGISKQTVNINKLVLNEKAKDRIIKYVPHGLNTKNYFPIENKEQDKEFQSFKSKVLQGKDYEFVAFFNSRNIRRKQVPDTLLAFKVFVDNLPQEKRNSAALLLHTELVSEHGTDLVAVVDTLLPGYNVVFTDGKYGPKEMNYLYNIADVQMLLTSNEGWGLSLTEALLTGTPIIANVTGGMQDQMRFEFEDGTWIDFDADFPSNHTGKYKKCGKWAFPVFPTNRSLVGSPPTPYIWDDRCNPEDATARIMELYNMTRKERKALGKAGYEWVTSEEAGFTAEIMGKRIIKNIDKVFETFTPRKKYEFINVSEVEENKLPHKLLY